METSMCMEPLKAIVDRLVDELVAGTGPRGAEGQCPPAGSAAPAALRREGPEAEAPGKVGARDIATERREET